MPPPSDAELLNSYTPEDYGVFYERHVTAVGLDPVTLGLQGPPAFFYGAG